MILPSLLCLLAAMLLSTRARALSASLRGGSSARRPSRHLLHSIEKELAPFRDTSSHTRDAAAGYDYHLLESHDVFAAAEHLYTCFDASERAASASRATLGMSDLGKRVYGVFYGLYSSAKKIDLYLGYIVGFITRGGRRLTKASEIGLSATPDSIVLVAAPGGSSAIAALIELTLERTDGSRRPAASSIRSLRPNPALSDAPLEYYISNLSVAPVYRRSGLGRKMVALAEQVIREKLGRRVAHLHVESSNAAAQRLYLGSGYAAVAPLLDEGVEEVVYYRKQL